MTKLFSTALAPLVALALCSAPAQAQEEPAAQDPVAPPGATLPSVDELVVATFTPQRLNRGELYTAAEHLFGEVLWVAGWNQNEFVDHFILLGDSILVRDTPERSREILSTLARLESEIAAAQSEHEVVGAPELVATEFTPHHIDAGALNGALGIYRRRVFPPADETPFDNIQVFKQRQALLIRDTRARVDEIVALLERLDTPAAQATVSVLVIAGCAAEKSSPTLPRELVENLGQLVPVAGFELVATGVLRGSVRQSMRLEAAAEGGRRYGVELEPEAYDAERGELTLIKCEFEYSSPRIVDVRDDDGTVRQVSRSENQSFQTATTLRHGEYTVLGAVGAEPVFVVLRMQVSSR